MLERLAAAETAGFHWRPFLEELSQFRLTDPDLAARLPKDRVAAGWLGEPPATPAQIGALETRLGRPLPPSYRSFLAESNGFQPQSASIWRLFRASEVDWFRTRNAGWAEAYRETYPNLGSCLQVIDAGDRAVILLNPAVVAPDGEWQAYYFANWIPGARPYRSFREWMQAELESACEWRNR